MTSCILVKSTKRLVAISDGRLSRDDDTQTFNSTRKLIEFPISYRIPIFSRGRFDFFTEYRSTPWYLAYAGTHTVTTEIIDLFRQKINSLYLSRDKNSGHSILDHSTFTSGSFDDDYNFTTSEHIKIHARDVVQELIDAFETRGNEYSTNRGVMPDSQFILFGNEEVSGTYKAFTVSADSNLYNSTGGRIRIKADLVPNGQVASIGSETVRRAVYADQDLMDGLKEWHTINDLDVDFDKLRKEFDGEPIPSPQPLSTAWSVTKVARRFQQIICATPDPSVGGDMIWAEGHWDGVIELHVDSSPLP